MISEIQPNYRNCPRCGKKVPYYGKDFAEAFMNKLAGTPLSCCLNCRIPFPQEDTCMIQVVIERCKQRREQPHDPKRLCYSTFYSIYQAYHFLYDIPLYSVEELLVIENLLHHGGYQENRDWWVASFRDADQPPLTSSVCGLPTYDGPMQLSSWHPLVWNKEQEIFLVGPDEGPRTVLYTPFE